MSAKRETPERVISISWEELRASSGGAGEGARAPSNNKRGQWD